MSTAAVMLVKDEADIIGFTIEHLLGQVDEIIVADNDSTDGTSDILRELADNDLIRVVHDSDVGYWQSKKTTLLARFAGRLGHTWVLPVDADEVWYADDSRSVAMFLSGIAPDVGKVTANLYHHFPTVLDDGTHPFRRIRHRLPSYSPLPKVAVRAHPAVVVHAGNHGADIAPGLTTAGGLALRHYSWRSADQYLRKIRNGQRAYAATDLPEGVGAHWRMFDGAEDESIRGHFYRHFFFDADRLGELLDDPAPGYE